MIYEDRKWCINLISLHDGSYQWHMSENVWMIGEPLQCSIEEAVRSIERTESIDDAIEFLRALDGFFSCIIRTSEAVFCFVDHVRSFPLLYTKMNDKLIITNCAKVLLDQGSMKIADDKLVEYEQSMFVSRENTLLDGVYQIPAGNYLVCKNDGIIELKKYFQIDFKANVITDMQDAVSYLLGVYDNLFEILGNKFSDQNVILPLSGGHDSRLIMYFLKEKRGIKSLSAYNYGKKSEMDYKYAKECAEKCLSDKNNFWHIDYSDKSNIKKFRNIIRPYSLYASNCASCPCVSELCSVEFLKETGKLNDESVIIPGYGGVVSGLYYKPKFFSKSEYTFNDVSDLIINMFYKGTKTEKQDEICRAAVFRWIKAQNVKEDDVVTTINALQLLQQFAFEEEQSKFIQNATQSFNYVGVRWFTPFMTKMILNAWGKISPMIMINDAVLKELENQLYKGSICTVPFCGSKEKQSKITKKFGRFRKYILPKALSKYDNFIPLYSHYYNLLRRRKYGINAYVSLMVVKTIRKEIVKHDLSKLR